MPVSVCGSARKDNGTVLLLMDLFLAQKGEKRSCISKKKMEFKSFGLN